MIKLMSDDYDKEYYDKIFDNVARVAKKEITTDNLFEMYPIEDMANLMVKCTTTFLYSTVSMQSEMEYSMNIINIMRLLNDNNIEDKKKLILLSQEYQKFTNTVWNLFLSYLDDIIKNRNIDDDELNELKTSFKITLDEYSEKNGE